MTIGCHALSLLETDVANHAQIAGLGHVGKGLEWMLCSVDRYHMMGESSCASESGIPSRECWSDGNLENKWAKRDERYVEGENGDQYINDQIANQIWVLGQVSHS